VRILGDFNIDILKYNSTSMATEYVDLLFSFGLLQVISLPTRCTTTSATLIDHIITNSVCEKASSFILTSLISDHFPIIHHCNSKKIFHKPEKVPYRDFSQSNIDRFIETLHGLNWSEVTDSEDAQ
jgi:hypothetical protein